MSFTFAVFGLPFSVDLSLQAIHILFVLANLAPLNCFSTYSLRYDVSN